MQLIDVDRVIQQAAIENGLNVSRFLAVSHCEDPSGDITKQSDYYKGGKREQSYGIFQINIQQNPSVSIASATDPVFAAKWSAEQWKENHANHWTCYRQLQAKDWK